VKQGSRVNGFPTCCDEGMYMRLAEGYGHEYNCHRCGCGIAVENYIATTIFYCTKHGR
jgi:hypothetical protein